jgi:hypothetical protein
MSSLAWTPVFDDAPCSRRMPISIDGPRTIRTQVVDGAGTTTYSVNYGYDNNGNQTSRGSDSFGWDHV